MYAYMAYIQAYGLVPWLILHNMYITHLTLLYDL